MARGRHRRRRQVPLVVGGLAAMAAGGCLAILVIGAPVVVGTGVAVGLAAWWIVGRILRADPPPATAGAAPPAPRPRPPSGSRARNATRSNRWRR